MRLPHPPKRAARPSIIVPTGWWRCWTRSSARRCHGSTIRLRGEVAQMTSMTTTPRPLIEMEGVYKQYGTGVMAISDMSLSIEQGQFVSFLGPSGCGKSTALRMIAGLAEVSAGKILVNGNEPGSASGPNDVGFVFQEPTLMPWANVFDNVYL